MTTEKGKTMSTTELIAEARRQTECRCSDAPEQDCGRHGDSYSRLIADLADALEAVITPTEADDWEALTLIARDVHLYDGGENAAITGPHADRIARAAQAAGFSRHPQPETEWEYGRTSRDRLSVDVLAGTPGNIEYQQEHGYGIVRRRKAGPWLRVTPEEAER